MLLGKRPRTRPPMKRTTSLSEIGFDLNGASDAPVPVAAVDPNNRGEGGGVAGNGINSAWKQTAGGEWLNNNNNSNGFHENEAAVSLLTRRHSADYLETADFLRSCGFCKRRLVPSRDIYMYRGDTAFCSLECRQQQMTQDERKDKRCVGVASKKQVVAAGVGASGSQVTTTKGETVAAL